MIYLISAPVSKVKEDGTKEYFEVLKIGYASNLEKRLLAYNTCNPGYVLINSREGGIDLEGRLHKYFSKYKYPIGNEWFYYNQEIIDGFKTLNLDENTLFVSECIEELIKSIRSILYKYKDNFQELVDKLKSKYSDIFYKDRNNSIVFMLIHVDWSYYYKKELEILTNFDFNTILKDIINPDSITIDKSKYSLKDLVKKYYEETSNKRAELNDFIDSILQKRNLTTDILNVLFNSSSTKIKEALVDKFNITRDCLEEFESRYDYSYLINNNTLAITNPLVQEADKEAIKTIKEYYRKMFTE